MNGLSLTIGTPWRGAVQADLTDGGELLLAVREGCGCETITADVALSIEHADALRSWLSVAIEKMRKQ